MAGNAINISVDTEISTNVLFVERMKCRRNVGETMSIC